MGKQTFLSKDSSIPCHLGIDNYNQGCHKMLEQKIGVKSMATITYPATSREHYPMDSLALPDTKVIHNLNSNKFQEYVILQLLLTPTELTSYKALINSDSHLRILSNKYNYENIFILYP